ncbi:MAG TPA: NADH-quinone oxidoreductase subunit L [Sphingobacteriaceae bacterium]|nr:NADH-quinone oxidoreductase subunit L [Sphingobacteriaceae bacterium]
MNDFLPYISQSLDQIINSLPYFYPELAIGILFLAVIITDLAFSKRSAQAVFFVTITGLLLVSCITLQQLLQTGSMPLFSAMIVSDNLSSYFKLIFCIVAILFVLFIRNNRQLQAHSKGTGDLYAILVAVLLGMNLMAMSANLIMIYLSIEMVSMGSYIMVGYISADNKQTEAAMKYALFGAVCSAIMLYGMSLIYAFTGTLEITDPAFISGLSKVPVISSGVAISMLLVGIGFKLSFAPLHFWSPDVYEGAPTPVTAFLSTGPKIAGFAILIRFLASFRFHEAEVFDFNQLLGIVAFITMIIGNFSAIWQNNVKRMLAYSSIGHTGFILMAVLQFSQGGLRSILFYLFIYSLMNMAAFMLADQIEEQTGAINSTDYKGLGKKLPLTFFMFVIVLISLTGLPPTAGFIGKLFIFSSVIEYYNSSGSFYILLLIITAAITTLVSLFYYIKIPLNAYLRHSETEVALVEKRTFSIYLSLFLMSALIIFGIFPHWITDFIII